MEAGNVAETQLTEHFLVTEDDVRFWLRNYNEYDSVYAPAIGRPSLTPRASSATKVSSPVPATVLHRLDLDRAMASLSPGLRALVKIYYVYEALPEEIMAACRISRRTFFYKIDQAVAQMTGFLNTMRGETHDGRGDEEGPPEPAGAGGARD